MTVPKRKAENPGYRGLPTAAAGEVLASQEQVSVGWWHLQVSTVHTRHVISSPCAECSFYISSVEWGGLLTSKVLCGF